LGKSSNNNLIVDQAKLAKKNLTGGKKPTSAEGKLDHSGSSMADGCEA